MASKYWIKLYHEILDDPKMGRMTDRLWRRTIELFLMAGEYDDGGVLPAVNDMAWRMRINEDSLYEDLIHLLTYGIVHQVGEDFIVTKFAERQAPVSDAERMRRMRERNQKGQYYGDESVTKSVTRDVTKRKVDTDTDKDKDIDTDKIRKKDETENLFDECIQIYQQKKGNLVTDGQAFSLMINNFLENGVIAEDYSAAIDAQDADGSYKGGKPTSYEKWAIGYAERRKNPVKKNGMKNTAIDNEKLLRQAMENGELD